MKKTSDIALALCMCFFIITLAVTLTLNFKQLYYDDAEKYDVGQYVGLTLEEVKENYDALIDYNSLFGSKTLNFPDLTTSYEGEYHFMEVKNIFVAMQIFMIASGLVFVGGSVIKFKKKDYGYLLLGSILTIVIPLVVGIAVAINWEWAFITFHQIAFSNDYWIFDPSTDPVILILPDAFFMHCALLIVGISIWFTGIALIIYLNLRKYKVRLLENNNI
ncbi:MAG: TIGR01906 family membrane protein [Clostridia bacterium]